MDTPRPQLPDFQFHQNNDSFILHFQQRLILRKVRISGEILLG